MGAFAGPESNEDGLVLALDAGNTKSYDSSVRGQQTYTSSGTYSWTCPANVTSVSVVCIGGGGGGNGGGSGVGGAGGGGGGGLGYKNNISVTPGQSYTVVVGKGGIGDAWDGPPYSDNPADNGDDSYFIDATTVKGGGGGGGLGNSSATGGSGGTYVGDGGGNGFSGGTGSGSASLPATGGGGGSTGTYTGNATTRGTSKYISSNCTSGCLAGNGIGQGLLGTGSSGSYGRGGGANMETFANGTSGYTGAVRIMWGPDRSYPSTGVADQSTSTAFNDTSSKGNNGTLTNGPTYSSDDGGALVFDGTNDYITFSSSSSFGFGTGDFTVELFIRPDVVPSGYIGLCGTLNTGSPVGFAFGTDSTGEITFSFNSSSASTFTANSTDVKWEANVWQHIVFRRGSGDVMIFLDGSQIGTTKTDTANLGTSDDFVIGRYYTNFDDYYFDGKISNFRIYSKALTTSEIKQNFNALRGRYVDRSLTKLYDFTSAFFTVSRALTDSPTSDEHRFGPTQTEVRSWLSGSSNGGGSHSWANTYVDCPVKGYQRWTVPKTGKYRITAKGGGSGFTDTPDDYMRGVKVTADFNLTLGEKLILAVGQGVPDYDGDHCNGGGGASWVMRGNKYTTAIPLIVANGAGGDTSDGDTKAQPNTTLGSSFTVTPTSGEDGGSAVTGKQTTNLLSNATAGRGSQEPGQPNSGGWLSDGGDAGITGVGGHGFRNNLIGGTRSNSTAGYGGFGGGSGGEDESGSAGGGFTGAYGVDGTSYTGHGSSFVNDDNEGNVSVVLAQATTTFQNTDYTSEDQYQGWIKIEFIS